MKKTLAFLILFTLLCMTLTSAALVSYWDFSDEGDLAGSVTLTNNGVSNINDFPSFNTSGTSTPNSSDFDGAASNYVTDNETIPMGAKSINFWIKPHSYAAFETIMDNNAVSSGNDGGSIFYESGGSQVLTWELDDGVKNFDIDTDTISNNVWSMVTFTWNGTTNVNNVVSYTNGTQSNTATAARLETVWADFNLMFGERNGVGGLFFDGQLDEVKFFDVELTPTEVYNLYNYGTIVSSPFFSITTTNSWTKSGITVFNATVNFTNYITTNGTIFTGILSNSTSLYNIDLFAENYASRSFTNYNVSSNLAVGLTPSESVNITFRHVNDSLIIQEINVTILNSTTSNIYTINQGFINLSLLAPDSYELRTDAVNFTDRKYFFTVVSGSAENITVYLFSNVTGTELQVFHIRDTTNDEVTGAILRVERETTTGANLWSNYAEEITNAEGKANTYLTKGITNYYRFAVFVNGTAKRIYPSLEYYTSKTNFIAGVSETVEIFVVMEETDITNYYDELYSVTTDMGFVGNDTVWFSWLDAQNIISGAEMVIKAKFIDDNLSYVHFNTNTSGATTGNLSFTFTPINNTIYQISGYVLYDDFRVLVQSETHSYTVADNVDKNWGLLLAIIILAVVAVLSINFGVLVSSVFTILMLVFTNIIGFTNFPTTVITSLLALAIILFIKLNKGES